MGLMSVGAGSRAKLLWTNPAPSSPFAAQTIPVDWRPYRLILISYHSDLRTPGFRYSDVLFPEPLGNQALQIFGKYTYSDPKGLGLYNKGATFVEDGIAISDPDGIGNNYIIPYCIYGIV